MRAALDKECVYGKSINSKQLNDSGNSGITGKIKKKCCPAG